MSPTIISNQMPQARKDTTYERRDVQPAPTLTKTFDHPAIGRITVDCDTLALADRDQHLVIYTAP
jgi:hypothetical protein